MKKIFISYKRVDKEKVLLLKKNIELATGVDCWVDLEGTESGKRFDTIIVSAINNADIVLFMYSSAHYKIKKEEISEDWTMRELYFAWKKKKQLVLVNLDGSPLTDLFELHFGLEQYVDARSEESMRNLVSDIKKWLKIDDANLPINIRLSIKTTSLIREVSNRMLVFYKSSQNAIMNSKIWLGNVVCRFFSLSKTIFNSVTRQIMKRKKLLVGVVALLCLVGVTIKFQESVVKGFAKVVGVMSSDTIKSDTIVTDSILYNALAANMVFVEGGAFAMGATEEQKSLACRDEYPVVEKNVQDFYLSKYEVTQSLWNDVMKKNYPQKVDPSFFKGNNLPVERVSWDDCQLFIIELNKRTGGNFRLPTETEWEYAARGGKNRKGYVYSGGDNLDKLGWYIANSGNQTHAVGKKKPNELGLYDMSGNVSEWCSDKYKKHNEKFVGKDYNFRGGCWFNPNYLCRSAKRGGEKQNYTSAGVGLRIASDEIIRKK